MNGTSSLLSTVRKHLAARYQEELGQQLTDGSEPTVSNPAWRLVKLSDLRSPAAAASDAQAAVLLDAEIGLVLYVIPYAGGDDLQAQVNAASGLQSSLMPLNPPAATPDEYGTWQVALHWLVPGAARNEWEDEMVRLRQSSGFQPELVFDAIFYAPGELDQALAGRAQRKRGVRQALPRDFEGMGRHVELWSKELWDRATAPLPEAEHERFMKSVEELIKI